MLQFEYFIPVKIVFGPKKIDTIGTHVKEWGKKAMIVTTGTLFKEIGLVDRIAACLKAEGVDSLYFSDVSPNPHCEEADKGAALAIKTGCDVIIGVGGGSAIDAAKCIAVGAAQKEPTWPYWIGTKTIEKALPIIAVTTTSGTGSHITEYSVITNPATNEKPGAGSPLLYSKVAIVDPELMLSMPAHITAATGFDVLAHAIEAYTSRDANPITDAYCEQAIKLVGRYLVKAVQNGKDLEARTMMALADTYSGCSISQAVITMCHAMGHAVGGVCNTIHGESLAAMTPSTMRHSMNFKPEKYKNIGLWLTGAACNSTEDAVKAVETIIASIGMNIPLSKQGVKESDFDEIIKGAVGYMNGGMELDPAWPISAADVRKVLQSSL